MELLVVSSHKISCISFYLFLPCFKNPEFITTLLCFPLFYFHCIPLLLCFLFILWNIEELLTYTREHTGKAFIASRPCGFDPFSLYAITEVSRKPKHTHFNYWFQNDTFCAQFSPDHSSFFSHFLFFSLSNASRPAQAGPFLLSPPSLSLSCSSFLSILFILLLHSLTVSPFSMNLVLLSLPLSPRLPFLSFLFSLPLFSFYLVTLIFSLISLSSHITR